MFVFFLSVRLHLVDRRLESVESSVLVMEAELKQLKKLEEAK
jgi:hypothetical protein